MATMAVTYTSEGQTHGTPVQALDRGRRSSQIRMRAIRMSHIQFLVR